MKTVASESGHWYTRAGEPCYEVPCKSRPGEMRGTTLKDARCLGLVPSVTGISKMTAKPGLDRWIAEQIVLASLTLPRNEEETTEDFADRILSDSKEQAKKAAELGTNIHAAIEKSYRGEEYDEQYKWHVYTTKSEVAIRTKCTTWSAEKSFSHPSGYGGKVDLHNDQWVIDFKTKAFDASKKAKDLVFDEHVMQLAACRTGLDMPTARCANVFISTTVPGLVLWHEWTEENLARGGEMFKSLLSYWQHKNKYYPGECLMGMFDIVQVMCPSCGGIIEFQSKAGRCILAAYSQDEVPIEIAADILNDSEVCECGERVGVSFEVPAQTITGRGVIC